MDRPHSEVFQILRPGIDLADEIENWRREDPTGLRDSFDEADLYPDVRDSLAKLRAAGVKVVIAGNQPLHARKALEAMNLGADSILLSVEMGVEKPAREFFEKVAQAAGVDPEEILYVGDRLDNDVLPARVAGMRTVLLRRGPWGHLHAERSQAALADLVTDTLRDVPELVAGLR